LAKIATLQRGKFTHRPRNEPKFYGGEYPFIQTGNIVRASKTGGKIQYTQTLNELGLKVSRLFEPRIILITIAANIGDTAILDYPACFPDSVVSIKPNSEDLDVDYLNIYIKYVKTYLINLAPQAAQKNINLQQLSPTPVVIPPLKKQQEIVALFQNAYQQKQEKEAEAKRLLESIDAYLLEKLGIELPTQKETKKIFFTSLKEIQGKRFDPFYYSDKFNDLQIFLDKGNYQSVKLKDVTIYINGGKTPASSSYSKEFKEFPIIKAGSYTNDEINLKKLGFSIEKQPHEVNKYDIFILSAAHQAEYVGRQIKILMEEPDIQTSFVGELIRIRLDNTKCNPIYFFSLIKLNYFKDLINREKTGQTSHIYSKDIKHIKIPLPPLEVQDEIAIYISDLRNRAKELEKEAKAILKSAKKEVENMILGE
jgi:restriction endonuclease S subunit